MDLLKKPLARNVKSLKLTMSLWKFSLWGNVFLAQQNFAIDPFTETYCSTIELLIVSRHYVNFYLTRTLELIDGQFNSEIFV